MELPGKHKERGIVAHLIIQIMTMIMTNHAGSTLTKGMPRGRVIMGTRDHTTGAL